jgi:hypothetical protein
VTQASPDRVVPLDQALDFLPELRLAPEQARAVAHGRPVAGLVEGTVRLTGEAGLIALGQGDGERVRPVVVLSPAG